jgi:hypothetical protein
MSRALALVTAGFLFLFASSPLPAQALQTERVQRQELRLPADEFARKVIFALEYVDFPDVLLALSVNNDRPWERYDRDEFSKGKRTSLFDRWLRAATAPIPATDVVSELLAIQTLFEELPVGLRETPIDDAGGDVGRPGTVETFAPAPGNPRTPAAAQLLQSLKTSPGFFDVVSAEQAAVLQSNPMLQVEAHAVSAIEAALGRRIVDPSGTLISPQSVLVRYRYPSAKRWKDFRQDLSARLQSELDRAEKAGQLEYDLFRPETVSPEFRRLNKLVLAELLRKRFDPRDVGAAFFRNYQRMIAVHPFRDYNGRSLRILYRRKVGRPMFTLNFNHDLYTSPESYGAELQLGARAFDQISLGLRSEGQRAARASQMPAFFDVPHWWWFAAGPDGPALMSQSGPAFNDRLVQKSKDWLRQTPVAQRIEKKLFDQVFLDYRAMLREERILPQNPAAPLLRLPPPHVVAPQVPVFRRM